MLPSRTHRGIEHGPSDPHPEALRVLGLGGLSHRAALRHRDGGRDDASGDLSPRPRPRALVLRLRPALPPPGGRTLRRESLPAREVLPVPGRHQAVSREHPGPLRPEPRRDRDRSGGARPPLRGGQLGVADARGVGRRLAGSPRRDGDHAVHLLPAGGGNRPRPRHRRDHVRPRTARDVPREQEERLRDRMGAGDPLRRGPPPGRVRSFEVQLRGGGHVPSPDALRPVRGRSGALPRRGPRPSRLRVHAEVLARRSTSSTRAAPSRPPTASASSSASGSWLAGAPGNTSSPAKSSASRC